MRNATVISVYELVFVIRYGVLLRPWSRGLLVDRIEPIVTLALAAWLVSITISLLFSPYDLAETWPGWLRYGWTIMHVVFFLAVRDFLGRYRLPLRWLLLTIPAAGLFVAIVMAYQLINLESVDASTSIQWWYTPPFNTHIRHTGYLVTAGIAALLVYQVPVSGPRLTRGALLVVLTVLWTLLIWSGGRAAILSVLLAVALLGLTLRVKGMRSRELWLATALAIGVGAVLAEWLSVFPWNGVVELLTRTTDAVEAQDLNQFGSRRIEVWTSTWDSVRDHLSFGLGPQGYWYMPNRVVGIQPHNLVLQFVVEWGVVGSVIFLSLLVYAFFYGLATHILRAGREVDLATLAAGSVIAALTIHGLVDGTYYHPQPSFYLAIAFAIWTAPPWSKYCSAEAES